MNKVLTFLSLADKDGNLSLTNVALVVVVVKIAIAPQASIVDLGALLLALANYAHKRYQNAQIPLEAPTVDLSPIESRLDALDSAQNVIDEKHATLTKDVTTLKTAMALKSTR